MGSGYGKTVIDGVIQYLSPSSMTTGDPNQPGGCLRRWLYKYVMGLKEPFTGSQKLGVETHAEIEHYQRTGEVTLGHLAMGARQFIPDRSELHKIEHKIQPGELFVAGIRVVGHIDLVRLWGMGGHSWSTDQMGESRRDPDYTIEELDWKTTSNVAKWAKTGPQLIKTIQMPLYGQWAVSVYPAATHVRLSHVYMQTCGRPISRKATVLLNREQLSKRWEQIEGVARSLIDVATEDDINKVPANRHACSAFRGCPRRDICPASKSDTLQLVFGAAKAKEIKSGETKNMSILDELNQIGATPAVAPVPVPAEPQAVTSEQFRAAVTVIEASGKGFPNLSGHEALAFSSIKGLKPGPSQLAYDLPKEGGGTYRVEVTPSGDIKGSGEYSTLAALSFDQVVMLGGQTAPTPGSAPVATATEQFQGPGMSVPITVPVPASVQPEAPEAVLGLVPQGTPASDPANAALPVAGFVKPGPAEPPASAPPVHIETVSPQAPPPATDEPEGYQKILKAAETGKFGPCRKDELAEAFVYLLAEACSPGPALLADAGHTAHNAEITRLKAELNIAQECAADAITLPDQGLVLYINTVPSCPFDRLDEYTRGICASLEKQTGARDIRCSDHSALDFGKWKGAVAAMVRENPPTDAVYYINTRGDEVAEIIANTLCEGAAKYAKGV